MAWQGLGPAGEDRKVQTAVGKETLLDIAKRASEAPEHHKRHEKINKLYTERLEMVRRGKGIDYGCAEMLAFGSLLREGTPIRLAGQDTADAAPSATGTPYSMTRKPAFPISPSTPSAAPVSHRHTSK